MKKKKIQVRGYIKHGVVDRIRIKEPMMKAAIESGFTVYVNRHGLLRNFVTFFALGDEEKSDLFVGKVKDSFDTGSSKEFFITSECHDGEDIDDTLGF